MSDYVVLNEDNFDNTVANGLVLVDFWATWCGPCKMLAPTIDAIATEYKDKVVVGKVDVDESEAIARRFGIMSIPTLFLFKDGEVVEKLVGYRLKMELEQLLNKYL
mgnify:FL=1